MPFAATLSTAAAPLDAIAQVCDRAGAALGGPADLAVLFFSAHHARAARLINDELQRRLRPAHAVGCVAEAVAGEGREVEGGPGLSLWLARWARPVRAHPFHLTLERTADGPSLLGWPDTLLGEEAAGPRAVLLLGDPYTFPVDLFLTRMNEDARGVPVLGGMASGTSAPGDCRLIHDAAVCDQGAVGVLLEGPIGLRWVVSQGCRPIGRPMVVTAAQQNVILGLGGKTPLEQLRELWPTLSPSEQQQLRLGLHLGRALNEYRGEFHRGDFLIRNVMGFDRSSGALVVGDHVRVGQTVQFQLRDAASAAQDLHDLLRLDVAGHDRRPAAALLFSCNGRGTQLFAQPDHDATAVAQEAGPVPLAGFFAQGELGPVGGQNFIHGFTASVALFEE